MRNERLVVSRDKLLEEVWDYHPYRRDEHRRRVRLQPAPQARGGRRGAGPAHGARLRLRAEAGVSGTGTRPRANRLRLPIRLKLALVSAGADVRRSCCCSRSSSGRSPSASCSSSFDAELRATAADLQERLRVKRDDDGEPTLRPDRRHAGRGGRRTPLPAARSTASRTRTSGRSPHERQGPRAAGRGGPATSARLPRRRPGPCSRARSTAPTASSDAQHADRRRRGVRAVRASPRRASTTTIAKRPALPRARRARRHAPGLPRRTRRGAPRDAPDRRADPGRPRGRASPATRPSRRCPSRRPTTRSRSWRTPSRRCCSELDAARAETEAALERQREFVADASHELRTPLTSILANLELLEDELGRRGRPRDPAPRPPRSPGSALRSSKRMRRLVGDLLLLARADAGREAPRQTLDLAKIVREAATEAGALASGHTVSLDLPGRRRGPGRGRAPTISTASCST